MPDISKLPLMPGDDTLRPEDRSPAPQASAAPAEVAVPSGWYEDSACDCPVCREVRASRAAQAIRGTPDLYREVAAFAIPDLGAQAFQTVTGRSRAGEPAMQDVPLPTTRISGRYTQDRDANSSLAGGRRWLEPSTGALYDTVSDSFAINSGLSKQDDGTWVSPSGMVWEAV